MTPKLLAVISVFVGGLVGTSLRLGFDLLLPHETGRSGGSSGWFAYAPLSGEVFVVPGLGASIAWSTVVVNLFGSLVLGFLVARLWRLSSTPAWLKTGLGTGLLGSFTTFSAIAVNVVDAVSLGNIGVALSALGLSLVGGILAAWAGLALGSWHAGSSQTARTRRVLDAIPNAGHDANADAGPDAILDRGVDQ